MQRARKLGKCRILVVVNECKRTAAGLGELSGIGEHASLAAQRLLFGRVGVRGGDLVDLVAEQIEAQRSIALGISKLSQLRGSCVPLAMRLAGCGEKRCVLSVLVEQFPIALS